MSVASTRAAGRSVASATARQPLPVPISAISRRGLDVGKQLEGRFDDELGFGPGDQHGRRDLERQAPELLAAEDVGHRLALHAAFDEPVVRAAETSRAVHRRLTVRYRAVSQPRSHCASRRASRAASASGIPACAQHLLRPRRHDRRMETQETAVASLSFSDW